MKKLFKRSLAMLLAVMLVIGQIAIPASAEDILDENGEVIGTEVTIDLTDLSGNVIGSETTGEVTVETAIPDGTKTETTEYKEGQTVVPSNGGYDVNAWSESSTDTQTQTSTSEQTQTDKSVNGQDNLKPIEKPEGWEGEWANEWDEDEKILNNGKDNSSDETDKLNDPNNKDWKKGEAKNKGEFGNEQVTKGGEEDTTVIYDNVIYEANIVIPYDHLTTKDESVNLWMSTPAEGETATANGSRTISLNDIKAGLYPEIYDPATVPTGYTAEVTEYTEDGVFKGWRVIMKKITAGELSEGTITGGEETYVLDLENAINIPVDKIEKYEKIIEGGGSVTSEDGKITTTVEKTAFGYKETVDTVVSTNTVYTYDDSIGSDEEEYPSITSAPTTTTTFTPPPAAPGESVTYNPDGTRTEVTVVKLTDATGELTMEAGQEVGYTVKTITYDMNGNVIESLEQDYYGTRTETTTTTTLDPVTKETATTTTIINRDIKELSAEQYSRTASYEETLTQQFTTTTDTIDNTYKMVNTADGGMMFVYTAEMGDITDLTKVGYDYSLAAAEVESLTGANGKKGGSIVLKNNSVDFNKTLSADDLRMLGEAGITVESEYTGKVTATNNEINGAAEGEWHKIGIGLQGGFLTWDDTATANNGSGRHTPQQYMIYDGETVRFVYCVELGKSIDESVDYASEHQITPDTNTGEIWENASGTIRQVSIVATNGFWGTREGLGSLDAVKQLLIDNNMQDVAERLTDGKAMAATQLALWEFTHTSNGAGFSQKNGDYVTWDDSTNASPTEEVQKDIDALRNLLIELANKNGEVEKKVEQITGQKIEGTGIVVKETKYDDDGEIVLDNQGRAAYNTDVQFKLNVSSNSITGNLVVTIADSEGNVIKKARLAGEEDGLVDGILNIGTIRPDENGVYTLTNVELIDGVPITLNLEGVQMLENGIYIYKNENSQDFVGLATQKNNVDISFDLTLRVTDPRLNLHGTEKKEERVDTKTSTRDQTRVDTIDITFTSEIQDQIVQQDHVKETILGTETVKTDTYEHTKSAERWNLNYHVDTPVIIDDPDPVVGFGGPIPMLMALDIDDEPVPMAFDPAVADDLIILDEAVPLAVAPSTGDASFIWAAMGLLSMGGYTFLGKKSTKKDEEEI